MKRFLITFLMLAVGLISFAQVRYIVRTVPTSRYYTVQQPEKEYYYLDRKIAESKANKDNTINAGLMTRFGYAFNYDAFTYGVSLLYQWNKFLGVTAGFDGYYIPNKTIYNAKLDEYHRSSEYSLPLWNIRAGFGFSKYFWVGALLGKSNINDADNIVNMRKDAWFINNSEKQFMYGGFVTFVLPVSKYFGFNLDIAVTNKTGFNVGAGFNVTIPIR